MASESNRPRDGHTSDDAEAVTPTAPTTTQTTTQTTAKAVLGGAAAVLAVVAIWAGGMRPTALPPDVRQAREQRIAAMSGSEREQLKQNFAAFEQLLPVEQQRLRDLNQAISADENREELLAVIKRYDVWLGEFSYRDRHLLKDMPIDDRVAEIARRKVKDYRLPNKDVLAVAAWLKRNAETRYRDENQQRWEQMPPLDRSLRALGQMISRFERLASEDVPADDKLKELIDQLSEGSQKQLRIAGDVGEQRRTLADWLRQSDLRRQLQREITREITREQAFAYIGRLSEEEQRRWRGEWQRDPDHVRRRIYAERQLDMRGPRSRRGPGPESGPGRRPDFRPGGPGGPDRPLRRGGPGGFGRPGVPPPHPGEGAPLRPRPPEDATPLSGT